MSEMIQSTPKIIVSFLVSYHVKKECPAIGQHPDPGVRGRNSLYRSKGGRVHDPRVLRDAGTPYEGYWEDMAE